jgi:hypothetical protein
MRESQIETHLKRLALQAGGRSYKWVSPGLRGVPDQIVLLPVAPEHQAIVARYIRFVECKAPGEHARGQQELRHEELRALGFHAHVVDTIHGADVLLDDMRDRL